MLSIFDIFKIGVGPSSSHTVGPMRIASRFLREAADAGCLDQAARVAIDLHGSLALTGIGHGTDRACLLGLAGFDPETLDAEAAEATMARLSGAGRLALAGGPDIAFDRSRDLALKGEVIPTVHPNEMVLRLHDTTGATLFERTFYSVGGGFIASADQLNAKADDDLINRPRHGRHFFASARDMLTICTDQNLTIAELILQNEDEQRPRDETLARIDTIWEAMSESIDRGLATRGELPGGLKVRRRAPALYDKLQAAPLANEREQLFDWLNVYAMAVNEENAAGGRVVTAPTNGAAGIIPAVIRHYCISDVAGDEAACREKVRVFLATAAGIGMLYKQRASISGAEMGCQGEVGVACSMAAAGLAAVWGGTPLEVESAAEIGMEHNLGLTCDPVGGLVQIPCIERNAIGAVKAVNAARLALRASEGHKVSLDQVIETMRQTGLDMSRKYKETSEGGLAVNVVEC